MSPLRRDGSSRPQADSEPGLALREATERKGEEAEAFLQKLACGRALASPAAQRGAVAAAYARRWGQMLAIAAQTAFASSLCELPIDSALAVYASAPPEGDVLSDARRAPGA